MRNSFLKIREEKNVPRDGFYYPSAFEVIYKELEHHDKMDNFLNFTRHIMAVDIHWKNSYILENYRRHLIL